MSPISSVQQGVVAQYEFAKLLILTSDGQLEPAVPVPDDDRRDFEVHVKRNFKTNLAVQLKSAIFLQHQFRSYNLAITFTVRKDRLVSDPLFWYAIMCLNLASLGYRDVLFLVNSEEMHRHESPRLIGDIWHFEFFANMSPDSKDRWRPSQVTGKDLGKKVLQLLREVPLRTAPSDTAVQELSRLDQLVWVRRRALASEA
jgi:hypothetical protein